MRYFAIIIRNITNISKSTNICELISSTIVNLVKGTPRLGFWTLLHSTSSICEEFIFYLKIVFLSYIHQFVKSSFLLKKLCSNHNNSFLGPEPHTGSLIYILELFLSKIAESLGFGSPTLLLSHSDIRHVKDTHTLESECNMLLSRASLASCTFRTCIPSQLED